MLAIATIIGTRWLLVVPFVIMQLWQFHGTIPKSNAGALNTALYLRSRTAPDDVLLIYGMEWNPAICYYAERKCVMMTTLIPRGTPPPNLRYGAVIADGQLTILPH